MAFRNAGKELHVLDALLLIVGLALLTIGAESLVQGASRLASWVGIPSLIIGLTIVAFGTSAPEFAVGIKAGLDGKADIASGNVMGSNIFNVFLILGLSALVTPLQVKSRLVRIDVPIMILVTGLAWLFSSTGYLSLRESILLLMLLGVYVLFTGMYARRKPEEVPLLDGKPSEPSKPHRSPLWTIPAIVLGLFMLVLGARWLVEGASGLARLAGVNELTIGLIVVAAGTSLPELATSLVAGLRGERDIAVGNVVGSNIFNVLGVLGASGIASGEGLPISGMVRDLDLPMAFAASVVCLPIFLTGAAISRHEGACFLFCYVLYTALVLLRAVGSPLYEVMADVFFYVLLPAAGLFILFVLWFAYHEVRRFAREISDDVFALFMGAVKNARKAIVIVVGGTLILAGIAMMVLPGPATIVIPLGIAILSTEFIWARRLLKYVRMQVEGAVRTWMGTGGESGGAGDA